MNLGVVSNPLSRRNRNGDIQRIRKMLAGYPRVPYREASNPQEIRSAVEDLVSHGVDIIAINGGDGTVQASLTALLSRAPAEQVPLLAVLPGGRTNMIARDIGSTPNPSRALRRLLAWEHRSPASPALVERPVLRLQHGSRPPLLGMFFGAGLIVQGTLYCRALRDRLRRYGLGGVAGTALGTARLLAGLVGWRAPLAPTHIAIDLDEQRLPQSYYTALLVTTHQRLAAGLRPFWGSEPRPMHCTAVLHPAGHLLRALPALARGRPNRHLTQSNGYLSHNANRIRLYLQETFTFDGELFESAPGESVVLTADQHVSFIRA